MARAELQPTLLNEGILMVLTSQIEWFISQLMHSFFERFPLAAGDDEKVFSMQDLMRINLVKEARKALIESRVEQRMRKSLDDWLKFFSQKAEHLLDFLDRDLPAIQEVFEQRMLPFTTAESSIHTI